MKSKYILLVLTFFFGYKIQSQSIYNAYANVTSITNSTLLAVNNVNTVNHSFIVNELVVVMQMQDNVIGTNTTNVAAFGNLSAIQNAGKFELAKISAVNVSMGTPTSIAISSALVNSYNIGTNSSVQIISFRKLSAAAFTSTNNISGLPWNGIIGGVIAIEVGTKFTLLHNLTANGLGFRGGLKNTPNFASTSCDATYAIAIGNKWAGKGEGIYKSTNAAFTGARGKILNGGGGGNDENSGGGGGGNYTLGGIGGPGYTGATSGCTPTKGGLGGISLSTVIGANRIFMGGGGGAGHENNNVGSAGGVGGGIILLKTSTLVTTGACGGIGITANGVSAVNSGNDGSGGGGAAGSIILQVNSFSVINTCSLTISSNGGNGGNAITGATHSGGGGGGQGVIIFSGTEPSANVKTETLPGNGGLSCTGCATSVNATAGGGPNNLGVFTNITTVLPIEILDFTALNQNEKIKLNWATETERNTAYFVIEKSIDANIWEDLTKVTAAKNSYVKLNYETIDNNPFRGVSYYRVRMVNIDGTSHYSPIQAIEFVAPDFFSVYPNPANSNFNVKIKSISDFQSIKIIMFDALGNIVYEENIELEQNKYDYKINTILKNGCYTVKLINSNETYTTKIVIID